MRAVAGRPVTPPNTARALSVALAAALSRPDVSPMIPLLVANFSSGRCGDACSCAPMYVCSNQQTPSCVYVTLTDTPTNVSYRMLLSPSRPDASLMQAPPPVCRLTSTFLVGDAVTLADVVVCCSPDSHIARTSPAHAHPAHAHPRHSHPMEGRASPSHTSLHTSLLMCGSRSTV